MSEENVEIVRRSYEHFVATGEFLAETMHDDFVWDMSTFRGWPDRQSYSGIEGATEFNADWDAAWDDWRLEVEVYIDAGGDRVVTIVRQRGRSKTSGVTVDMRFGQVFKVREAQLRGMRMYASPSEALEAAGLSG